MRTDCGRETLLKGKKGTTGNGGHNGNKDLMKKLNGRKD
jgi:hypothetical protein